MRFFYLRSEDKVKDFFSGFTHCRHTRTSDPVTAARDCERCLRDFISRYGVQEADNEGKMRRRARILAAITNSLINQRAGEEVDSYTIMDAILPHLEERQAFPPGSPVGCIASELVGDTVYYAVSVCSVKDKWNKRIARTMAIDRLRNRDRNIRRLSHNPNFKSHAGSVSVQAKPVKIEVLKRVAADPDIPRHARRAAETWLAKHPPKPVEPPGSNV